MRKGPNFSKPEYPIWAAMVQRCTNKNDKSWPRYGGRGIFVCARWLIFLNFYSDMGSRPDGYSLDRIDNNGNYSPDNCRWTSIELQARNKRAYSSNKYGISGVVWRKDSKKFRAQIGYGGKMISLGSFNSLDEAVAARKNGEARYWNHPEKANAGAPKT